LRRIATRATIGGTASAITGGKFGNGAITAGFAAIIGEVSMAYSDRAPVAHANDTSNGGNSKDGDRDRRFYAPEDGEIKAIGWENENDHGQGYGLRMKMQADSDDSWYVMGHLEESSIKVIVGDEVTKGQLLGRYADPTNGSSTGPHLHIEHWSNAGVRLDDRSYLSTVMPNHTIKSYPGPRPHHTSGKIRPHKGYDIVGPRNRR